MQLDGAVETGGLNSLNTQGFYESLILTSHFSESVGNITYSL